MEPGNGQAAEGAGAEDLADAGHGAQGQGEAQAAADTEHHALQEVVALLHVHQSCTQHGAVGGNEGQVDAQGLIKARHTLFQEHLHHLYDGGNDQNEGYGLHIFHFKRNQQEGVHRPGSR